MVLSVVWVITTQSSLSYGQTTDVSSISKQKILTLPEYYFDRGHYYSQIKQMKGKYKVIYSDYPTMFPPLYIPVHKGIRRIGVMPMIEHYSNNIGKPAGKMDLTKKAFLERLWNDTQLYNNLKLVNLMSSHINSKNLKIDRSNTSIHGIKKEGDLYEVLTNRARYVLKTHLQSLAAGMFSAEAYQKYFCSSTQPCLEKDRAVRGITQWGGKPVDQFRGYKVYSEFVENQLAKIKLWACQLNHSVYIVGRVVLGEYDFDNKAFNITLLPPTKSFNGYRSMTYAPAKGKKQYLNPNSQYNRLMIKLSETDAEKLIVDNSNIYYAIRGKLTGFSSSSGRRRADAYFAGVNLSFDLTGSQFEFYSDDLLTNKVFQKTLSD